MCFFLFFFSFTIPSTTEIYTLSLHDALPISRHDRLDLVPRDVVQCGWVAALDIVRKDREERRRHPLDLEDRKSTRLNSSHANISYAVFCLKKKKKKKKTKTMKTRAKTNRLTE